MGSKDDIEKIEAYKGLDGKVYECEEECRRKNRELILKKELMVFAENYLWYGNAYDIADALFSNAKELKDILRNA